MDPIAAAALSGLIIGLVIAVQFGAVSLLLVETAVVRGPRAGVAAGMGVATADVTFAAVAVAAGRAAGTLPASHGTELRLLGASALAAVAVAGLIRPPAPGPAREVSVSGQYGRFLAITAANPLTIVSFTVVAAPLSLSGGAPAVAFVGGVGVASAAWHLVLTLAAGHGGRWLTPRARRGLAIGGRVGVLAVAAHLALGA